MNQQLSYQAIAEAIDRCAAQSWEPECALGWLEQAQVALETEIEETVQKVKDSGYYSRSPDEIECGLAALEAFHEVLALLYEHQMGGAVVFLEEARELALDARETMRRAVDLNLDASNRVAFSLVN